MSFNVAKIEEIKQQARRHIDRGALTDGYRADAKEITQLLNDALATELVCILRYKNHHDMAMGLNAEPVAAEFLEHANDEQRHADMLAKRITQLNGTPNYSPVGLAERSHTHYVECNSLGEMIKENLIAERIAVDIYKEVIQYVGDTDPTTRVMLENILKDEEEHADDLANILQ